MCGKKEISSTQKIFFIVGCQRSGTTLMRLILDSHSKVSCIDEFRAYSILKEPRLLEKEFENNGSKEILGFKVPRITEQMLEPILADAGADHIRITNFYRNHPIIFMVRNPLDTITSMKKLRHDDKSWLEIWAESTINFWLETIPDFQNIYAEELQLLENTKFKSIVAGAIYWKVKTSSYYNYVDNCTKIILIRYEDLVTKPKETISKVLDFLKLKWEDNVLNHEKMPHSELDEAGLTIGKTDPKSPIYQSSLKQYLKYLSSEEISQILTITMDLMLSFNYSISDNDIQTKQTQFEKTFSFPIKKFLKDEKYALYRWIKILQNDMKIYDERIIYQESQLTHLHESIKEKESQLTHLHESIKEKESQLTQLQISEQNYKKMLESIHSSLSWRLLRKYDRIREKLK